MVQMTERLADLGVDVGPTLKRFYGDADLLVDMLHEFAAENLIAGLSAACAAGDWSEAERIAHAVKGTSANLGLVELSARCNDVVQAARSGQTEGIEGLADRAVECFCTVSTAIAAL